MTTDYTTGLPVVNSKQENNPNGHCCPSSLHARVSPITAFVDAGCNPNLLISICPPGELSLIDAADNSKKVDGKSPGIPTGEAGSWKTYAWSRGLHEPNRTAAIKENANCGLILGVPFGGYSLVALALDLLTDTEEKVAPAIQDRQVILDTLVELNGGKP